VKVYTDACVMQDWNSSSPAKHHTGGGLFRSFEHANDAAGIEHQRGGEVHASLASRYTPFVDQEWGESV